MTPRALEAFLAVVRLGTFTRAAGALHLAQSSVSDRIAALEAELGTALFTRERAGLRVTPAGDSLVDHARAILAATAEARAAVETAQSAHAATLTIGALETVAAGVLPGPLDRFRRKHPEVRVRVEVAGSAHLLERVLDGACDAVLWFRKNGPDGRLACRTLAREPVVMIGAPVGAADPVIKPGRVPRQPFIATAPGCVYRSLHDGFWAERGEAAPHPAIEVGSINAIVHLVGSGAGIALVPRMAAAAALGRGALREISWPGAPFEASLDMVWRRRRVQPRGLSLWLAETRDPGRPLRSAGARPRRAEPIPS